MQFEWDSNKAAENYRKHKVSFDEALAVFRDPLAAIFNDASHSVDEEREIIIGHSNRNRILLVCFIEHKKEVIRLFSARRATKKEKADYEENANF